MPIPLPELDDRTFAGLVDEGRALIPALAPAWTNHNAADPGIVVLELLAWLTETAIYRLDQLPEPNTEVFLTLLGGERRPDEPLATAVQRTVLDLRTLYRAVTAADYEMLALSQWPASPQAQALLRAGADPAVARVRAVPSRDLSARASAARRAESPAHVSLIVVPASDEPLPEPSTELCDGLWRFLDQRRLLTARHHVLGPTYVRVELQLAAYLRDDAPPAATLPEIAAAVLAWFDPLRGGPEGTGWPFGRDVYVSEIDAEVSRLDLIDFLEDIVVTAPGNDDRVITEAGEVVGVALDANELVDLRLTQLVAHTTDGTRYDGELP